MSRIHRKFGRSNRAPGHGAEHPGQARGSARKRERRAAKAEVLAAEAARLGITVVALRQRQQREVDAAIAAQRQVRSVVSTPPPRHSWQSSWY